MAQNLEDVGIPLDGLAASLARGELSLEFMDAPAYERFSSLGGATFREVSNRTGIPVDLLMVVREVSGSAQPMEDDSMRDGELAVVPFLELQLAEGFRPVAIERLLRVMGDGLRRITASEGDWWQSEVIEPRVAAGATINEAVNPEFTERIAEMAEQTLVAIYHSQQSQAWTRNIIEAFEESLIRAGLHRKLDRPPAMCFLDITGYTRLTQERGDDAAADLATTVARLVRRSSVQHGGKPIKWLGDGVMFYFGDPGPGVRAALEMVDGLAAAGLPPAHVGLHAGPVLFQEGDYFGQTVNLTARIADYARQGEVLVSQAVADASREEEVAFDDIGPVELKGVSGTVHLLRAHLA